MNFHFRTLHLAFAAAFTALFLSSGCVIDKQEQQMYMQRQEQDARMMQDDLRRLRSRIETLEQDMMRMSQNVQETSADQLRANQSQVQALNASMDELQQQIRAVDTRRERDKQEIIDALSAKMAAMIKANTPRGGSQGARQYSGEGYEHVVQSGETLSAIAKAYGANANEIVRANNLQSADKLYVGQTLFIPAP